MFKLLRFFLLFAPVTLYCSTRQILVNQAKATSEEKDRWGKTYGRTLLRLAGVKVDIDLSALDPKGHYVFLCNHQSLLDIPILFHALWGYRMRFVAKDSLFRIPVFGRALESAGHIPIDRGNRRAAMKSLASAAAEAQTGISPLIFPEGTRNTDLSKLLDFKVGGMILALKCGLPVAPLVMAGTGLLLPRGRILFRPNQRVRLKALPPVDTGRYTLRERERFREDMYALMNDTYRQMFKELS